MSITAKEKTRRMAEYRIILCMRNSIVASYDHCSELFLFITYGTERVHLLVTFAADILSEWK
jgi:hypothetical protein